MSKGLLIVVSAPAGCGKDTILERVLADCPDMHYSVSATTRQPREGEVDGTSYIFKSRGDFMKMIRADELLEYTEYVGNYYGTPKAPVFEMLDAGKDVILKIEVEGAANIKKMFPDCVLVFILPPSLEELDERLTNRGTEDTFTIKNRIEAARTELGFVGSYDYAVVNDVLDEAVEDFKHVVRAEKLSLKRGIPLLPDLPESK